MIRIAVILVLTAFAGHVSAMEVIDADKLVAPPEPTCIDVKAPLSLVSHQGIFKSLWIYRLERGPYLAEKIDAKGTYYRGPPGGVSATGSEDKSKTLQPDLGVDYTYDGGIYVPNDGRESPRIYEYDNFNGRSPVRIPPSDADCSTAGYVKDPATSKVGLIPFAVGGTIGGAAGGVAGKSMVPGRKMSYGQAAGVGAAGGLVAGLIIAGIVNHEIGKIVLLREVEAQDSLETLKALVAAKVPLREIPIMEAAPASQSAAPAATVN